MRCGSVWIPITLWSTLLGLSEEGQRVQERRAQERLSTEGRSLVAEHQIDMELRTGKRLD